MQVSVETTQGLERRMTVDVPKERINEEVDNRLKSLARTARMNGFRPGKVPLRVVKQRYGEQVRQEVLGEVVQQTFQEAVEQEKLVPAGMPKVELVNGPDDVDKDFSYTAAFEVYPEIDSVEVDNIQVEKLSAQVGDSDVDAMLEKLRQQRTEWADVEREAQNGDQVVVDFVGTIDGEAFAGGSAEGQSLVLGENRFITGFEDGLQGARANDVRELDLEFPGDYHNTELAGKPVHFSVTVKAVRESRLPEVDSEFAKAFGVESGDVAQLRSEVRDNLDRELKQTLKARLKDQVMDGLLGANEVPVPGVLVETEARHLMDNMINDFQSKGIDAKQLGLQPAQFNERALRRVKLGLLMGEIIRQNEIQASADKVRATLEEIAGTYEDPDSVIQWFYGDPSRLKEIEANVLEEQVVEWILERAQISEKEESFDAIMNPAEPEQASPEAS